MPESAQERQRKYADLGRRPVNFEKGAMVMLSTKNRNKAAMVDGTKKLIPLWIGPFEVLEQIGPVACRLKLPDNMRVHNVFYVSAQAVSHQVAGACAARDH